VEAPAEVLPFGNAAFDTGISSIGIMFAADHEQAARELTRVVRPGGRIVVTSWTADGFVGGMLAAPGGATSITSHRCSAIVCTRSIRTPPD
jgi:ubiquinone/menaquinone biosynthesis C-methylase UbiE